MTKRICLGKIVGVHGIKGEVKIKSFTGFDADIAAYGELEDKSGNKLSLKVVGHSKELIRAKVKGVEDRNASEALIGTELYTDRSVLPELEEEEFYHTDLIGLKVKLKGLDVGEVAGVYNFGAGDLVEIKLKDTKKTELIPFTKEYVPEVSIKQGFIIINELSLNFGEEEESHEG